MAQLAMMLAPGACGDAVGRALQRALTRAGMDVTAGPADPGAIVIEQLSRGEPVPDGLIWSSSDAGGVVRLYPGERGYLLAALPRAISAELDGLVIAVDTARSRERYLLGSFLAGRTVELTICQDGVVTGPGGTEMCDEDLVSQRFAAWSGDPDPRRLGLHDARGLLAAGMFAGEPEAPLARIAIRGATVPDAPGWRRGEHGDVTVLERDGPMDSTLASAVRGPAAGFELRGGGRQCDWFTVGADGARRSGTASGHEQLLAALPPWALN
jgi:hypothetical protein